MADTVMFQTVVGLLAICLLGLPFGEAIQCYQCDSNEDMSCPTDTPFDTSLNAIIDCSTFEANVPGVFCAKIYQEGPGWRPWKKITRRCSYFSETGVAWGCRWVWEENGVFRESCYCKDNGCNAAHSLHQPSIVVFATSILTTIFVLFKLK